MSTKCFPHPVWITGWIISQNFHSWTSANRQAMSDGNSPLMDTLTILCIRCAIHWAIWFGFSCWLKTGGRTRLYVHAHHVFHIVACRVPEPAVPLRHAGILDVFQWACRGHFEPLFSLAFRLAAWLSPKSFSASDQDSPPNRRRNKHEVFELFSTLVTGMGRFAQQCRGELSYQTVDDVE